MPLYDFYCPSCGKTIEISCKVNQIPSSTCPHCQNQGLERLYSSSVGVHFKGSGFYETDYKRKNTSCNSSCKDRASCPHAQD